MPHTDMSIPALLRTRATDEPDITAYTFMDSALDGTCYPESRTWEQVYRRSLVVADELRRLSELVSYGAPRACLSPIIELKQRGSADEHARRLTTIKHDVSTAIWKWHNLRVGDLVLASPGAIPITTSGKIRRSSCVELYGRGEFQRLDISV